MWRSLEDKYADPAETKKAAEAELLSPALTGSGNLLKKVGSKAADPLFQQPQVSRRGFLAASTAAASALALEGCARRPVENILPYAEGPEFLIPGIPIHFATVTQRGNDALGLLVTSHEGRPTKIEGNPNHPASLGATDLRAQLSVWDLYDPDRSQSPSMRDGELDEDDEAAGWSDKTFAEFDAAFDRVVVQHRRSGGAGLRLLMPPTNSPSVLRLRQAIQGQLPAAQFHTYASVTDANVREGATVAFGQPLAPIYDLRLADVILALDCDFLASEDGSVRHGRGFGPRRAITSPESERMNRLYAVEATYSITGANADHRLRIPSRDVEKFLLALVARLEGRGGFTLGALATLGAESADYPADFLDAVAADLTGSAGRAVLMVGRRQPPRVHALAHALNQTLGAIGPIVAFQPAADSAQTNPVASLQQLVAATDVQTLLILGGNPVYDAPGDIDFAGFLDRDGLTAIHLSSRRDETSAHCDWHVPLAHELEAWGDQRASDGTVSVQQPLIAPIWGARSAIELLAKVAGERNWRGHYVVRKSMQERFGGVLGGAGSFERVWRAALHRGVVPGTATRPASVAFQAEGIQAAYRATAERRPLGEGNFEVLFAPDPCLFDGTHANNLWALETPDPMTKIVWDNAALLSKTTRDQLGLRNGDIIKLSKDGREIELPVWVQPGHADFSVTLLLGWGRTRAGRYGSKRTWNGMGVEPDWQAGGFDVQPLRGSDSFYFTDGVTLEKTGGTYELVQTQTHGYMEGRPIAIDATMEEYRAEPEFASYRSVELSTPPLWQQVDYSPHPVATDRVLHKWGMTIDLSSCIGCNACVVACQAENNIPAVGKQEVDRGRQMAWLRIDRYFVGDDDDDPAISVQPVACQHCEEAPCENVCPVNATAHSPEGLNDMAYNRCIGTRYCANNCPYKVRRFNYLDWHNHLDDPWRMHGHFPETRKMQFNPNVTVRMRGVMEKCTYCTQRIQEAKFAARRDHRDVRDGEIVTACQAACPAGSIVFGDLNDPESQVSRNAAMNRRYKLLAELGASPRTMFLGKIRNPHPSLETPDTNVAAGEEH